MYQSKKITCMIAWLLTFLIVFGTIPNNTLGTVQAATKTIVVTTQAELSTALKSLKAGKKVNISLVTPSPTVSSRITKVDIEYSEKDDDGVAKPFANSKITAVVTSTAESLTYQWQICDEEDGTDWTKVCDGAKLMINGTLSTGNAIGTNQCIKIENDRRIRLSGSINASAISNFYSESWHYAIELFKLPRST